MESQKNDWTNAHAQLWTSFKNAQKGNESYENKREISMNSISHTDPLTEHHYNQGFDLSSSILAEVTKRTRPDEPVFSEELESRIVGLIEDERIDASLRDLLLTIIHLKNRTEKCNAENIYRQDSLAGAVNEVLFHLSGERPRTPSPTTTNIPNNSISVSTNERGNGNSEALADIENRLFSVLIQVEKCKEILKTFSEKNSLGKMLSRESSIREMLELLFSSDLSSLTHKDIQNDENEIIYQVMDILGAPTGAHPSQLPDLALKVMKGLEFARRENHANSVLLLQYERAVMAKFASCGVISPPTVEQERSSLLSSDNVTLPSSDDQWIMENLESLVSVIIEVNRSSRLNIVPKWLREGPVKGSAETILEFMRTSLAVARELLMILARNEMEAKDFLIEIFHKIINDNRSDNNESQISFLEEKPFMEVIHELKHLVKYWNNKQPVIEVPMEVNQDKYLELVMRISRWLPENDRKNILEMLNDENGLIDYIEGAVKRIVKSSNIQDPVILEIKKLNSQVEILTNYVSDQSSQIIDQEIRTKILDTVEQLRIWAMNNSKGSSMPEEVMIQQSLYELAQLLPTGVTPNSFEGPVRIDPPVNNLLDMIHLLKKRQEQWIQEQQKQQLTGAQSRLEKVRVEEVVKERSKNLIKITKEILLGAGNSSEMEEILGTLSSELVDEPLNNNGISGGSISSISTFFNDLEERLKIVKLRHHRLLQSYTANKVRLDNLIQSSSVHIKRWTRIGNSIASLCRTVGLEQVANHLDRETKVDLTLASSKSVLRPEQRKSQTLQPLNDVDIIDALKLLEERLKNDETLGDRAIQKSEIIRLKEEEKRWKEETDTFRKAMQMILIRLAESGRRIKRTLFILGTDESAEDEVVENVINEHRRRTEEEKEQDTDENIVQRQQREEADEESLAIILQKFGRWAIRLQETSEDHLYTQQKLTKYFAAVHRFFCANDESTVKGSTDENLIDIDTSLMRFADGILPVLDRAIGAAESSSEEKEGGGTRSVALSLLLKDAPKDRVLPMDHRLVRLYESVGKLRTMVAGLLSVRYLSIPTSTRRRGGDSGDELIFEDAWGDSYIELDLNKLKEYNIKTGTTTETTTTTTTTRSSLETGNGNISHISEDGLFRVVESNITSVYHALTKFSKNYKLAAILVQKDTDIMQQCIASMLEPYAELDVEQAFNQDPAFLNEMCVLLNERATRQRGCYFFNRVGGEGTCVWATALEQLSVGFIGILEKLRKRTRVATELRQIVDDVVDLCAMYVNWLEMSGATLSSSHPLPQEVVEAFIREDEEVEIVDREEEQHQQLHSNKKDKLSKPPLPPNHPRPKVSHFEQDDIVLKVIAHMFQVTQEVANISKEGGEAQQQLQQQLEEQLQLLRETAAVAEQRANVALEDIQRVEKERDKALSEAAVSRAELRRWKKQQNISETQSLFNQKEQQEKQQKRKREKELGDENEQEDKVSSETHDTAIPAANIPQDQQQNTLPPPLLSMTNDKHITKDVILLQVAQSMKELTEELRSACHRNIISPNPVGPVSAIGIETNSIHTPVRTGYERRDIKTIKGGHTRRTLSPPSSGLVRSPKACIGTASVQGSLSPRSTSSSPLPPSTRDSRSSQIGIVPVAPSTSVITGTGNSEMKGQQKRQKSEEDPNFITGASVVVSPVGTKYSSLTRNHVYGSSSINTRTNSATRYYPCKHREEFFNECDVCSRRHRARLHSGGLPTGGVSTSNNTNTINNLRSRSPNQRISTHSLRALPEAAASLRQLRHEEEMAALHGGREHYHNFQKRQQQKQGKEYPSSTHHHTHMSVSSTKMMSPPYIEKSNKLNSVIREEPSTTVTDYYNNHYGQTHHVRTAQTPRTSSLCSPSTSSVLSPESVIMPEDTLSEQQRYNNKNHNEKQEQNYYRMTPQNSGNIYKGENTDIGASIDYIQHHTSTTRTTSPSPPTVEIRTLKHKQNQHQQREQETRLSSTTPLRRIRMTQNPNLRSESLKKLADIVAKTKISGREEL